MSVLSALQRRGLGLALGGGAARGFAHIGVLKALEEQGIPVRFVAGSSAGSVIGAAFCAGYSWREILEKARSVDWTDIASITIPRMGLMSMARFESLLDRLFDFKSFSQLAIPFAAIAVDLASERQVVFTEGSVAAAVRASCSIPGIFEPVVRDGKVLVDGGLLNDVPADVVKGMGAAFVLAVDLNGISSQGHAPRSIMDVIHTSFNILVKHGSQGGMRAADLVVRPPLDDIGYQELKRIDELVDRGDSATREALTPLGRRRLFPRRKTRT